MKELKTKVLEELKTMSEDYNQQSSLQQLQNEAMDLYNGENYIYTMEDFNEIIVPNWTQEETINKVFYGDFNPNHDWACLDGYANYKSTMFIGDFIDYDIIVDYLFDTYEEEEILQELEDLKK